MGLSAVAIVQIVGTVVAVGTTLQAASQQRSAARKSEALAHENASNREREGERQLQLASREAAEGEASQRALAAASGIGGATTDLVTQDTARRNKEALEWMETATKTEADIIRGGGALSKQQGYAAASSTTAGAFQTAASAAGDIWTSTS